VGIGTTTPVALLHVAGNVTIDGSIAAKYQDVAEWVPSTRSIPAATVVVLDERNLHHVTVSSQAYDTRVAGVISETPGIILGEASEGKVKVAATGRVRVKVDASRGPIRAGDLLVTSDREGIAMRSEPVSFAGVRMHRAGTIIGKALESLDQGEGEILVLLSLQ
jgi:ribosomal protein S28E/S33